MSTKFVEVPVPAELADFFRWPPVLSTESQAEYRAVFTALANELMPRSTLEWLLFKDILESIWETRRWKNAKTALVDITRKTAVRQVLESLAVGDEAERSRFVAEMTEAWFGNAEEKSQVGLFMQKHGFRMQEVDAQAMAIRLQDLELMDRQLARARANQMTMLYELEHFRDGGHMRRELIRLIDEDIAKLPNAAPAKQLANSK